MWVLVFPRTRLRVLSINSDSVASNGSGLLSSCSVWVFWHECSVTAESVGIVAQLEAFGVGILLLGWFKLAPQVGLLGVYHAYIFYFRQSF